MPRTKVKDLRMHSALFIIHMCIVRTVVICRGACRVWLRPYELCIIWMRLHSYEWGFIHMNEASFIWMRLHSYEWGIVYMNEASFIWMRHHSYEWGIIHTSEASSIWMIWMTFRWRMHHMHEATFISPQSYTARSYESYAWCLIHMNEASFIWMRHHAYELYEWGIMSVWPQSYTARSHECMTSIIHGTLIWVMWMMPHSYQWWIRHHSIGCLIVTRHEL